MYIIVVAAVFFFFVSLLRRHLVFKIPPVSAGDLCRRAPQPPIKSGTFARSS